MVNLMFTGLFQAVLCLDGICTGNISCLEELENMTCVLKEDQSCLVMHECLLKFSSFTIYLPMNLFYVYI